MKKLLILTLGLFLIGCQDDKPTTNNIDEEIRYIVFTDETTGHQIIITSKLTGRMNMEHYENCEKCAADNSALIPSQMLLQ